MKRLFLYTLTLILLATALTGGVVSYARVHSGENYAKAMGFDVCDGKSCLYQIIPGVTTWLEAYSILRRIGTGAWTPDQSVFLQISGNALIPVGDNVIDILRSANGNFVENVVFCSYNRNTFPSLGDLFVIYGPPCHVDLGWNRNIMLIYPGLDIAFSLAVDRLILTPTLEHVVIRATSNSPDGRDANCVLYDGQAKWLGFTTINRYVETGLIHP